MQKLGLVAGLGIASVVGSGCEQRIDITRDNKIPVQLCADGRTSFIDRKYYLQGQYFLGIPISSELLHTVESEYSCTSYTHFGDQVYGLIRRRMVNPDGSVHSVASTEENIDPQTGEIHIKKIGYTPGMY